jgi:hypothetical protein
VIVGEREEAAAAGACAEPAFLSGDGDEDSWDGLVAWVDAIGGPGVGEGKEGVGGVGEGEGWGWRSRRGFFRGGFLSACGDNAHKCVYETQGESCECFGAAERVRRSDLFFVEGREGKPSPLPSPSGRGSTADAAHDW